LHDDLMLPAADAQSLALLYHLNSEPWLLEDPGAEVSLPAPLPIPRVRPAAPDAIELQTDETTGVFALALSRTSCRAYALRPMTLDHLTRMVHCGYGHGGVNTWPDGTSLVARPVPSAGGLYPLELYATVQRIEGLGDGLYRYDPRWHELAPQPHQLTPRELAPHLLAQEFVSQANAIVLIAADLGPTLARYGPRGYRYLLLEAGHVAQNLCLAATELALGSLCIGGFADRAVNALLGMDGRHQAVLYAVAFGHPLLLPSE
jgi:SagB-type dehydrogenase family enzyme